VPTTSTAWPSSRSPSPARETRIVFGSARSWESDEGIKRLAAAARQRGMKVLLKPQLWPNQPVDLSDPARRRAWFAQYRALVIHYSQLAAAINATLLCIGTELPHATAHETEFRTSIAAARAHFRGPITYAANHGEEFERIRFWANSTTSDSTTTTPCPTTSTPAPSPGNSKPSIAATANRCCSPKPGYAAAPASHRTPWQDRSDRPVHLRRPQAAAYEALLKTFAPQSWFAGSSGGSSAPTASAAPGTIQ
jgi:hypothetical protein